VRGPEIARQQAPQERVQSAGHGASGSGARSGARFLREATPSTRIIR
jgi:hypothetical protein